MVLTGNATFPNSPARALLISKPQPDTKGRPCDDRRRDKGSPPSQQADLPGLNYSGPEQHPGPISSPITVALLSAPTPHTGRSDRSAPADASSTSPGPTASTRGNAQAARACACAGTGYWDPAGEAGRGRWRRPSILLDPSQGLIIAPVPDEKLPDDVLWHQSGVLWHQSGVNAKGEPFVQLIRGTTVIYNSSRARRETTRRRAVAPVGREREG
jgi:hypothetical protein